MSRVTLFADIIIPVAVPNLFTYRIPQEMNELCVPGKRVIVQFGKSKYYSGIIRNIHEKPPKQYEAKYIESILDDEPIVNEIQLNLWEWMANYYLCYPGELMNAALPSGLKLDSQTKVILNPEKLQEDLSSLNNKEFIIVDALKNGEALTTSQIAELIDIRHPQLYIKKLVTENIVQVYEEIKNKFTPKKVVYLKLKEIFSNDENELQKLIQVLEKKAFKQLEFLLRYLTEVQKQKQLQLPQDRLGWIAKNILAEKGDYSVLSSLIKKGVFEQLELEVGRFEFLGEIEKLKPLSLAQEKARQQIVKIFSEKNVCLLHGVTGSGKTEVYLHLIEENLKQGKQVLYLVPEIALTTQLIYRVQHCFGDKVGVYHSRFSENERVEIWNGVLNVFQKPNSINQRKYEIIVGARSSLFLPFSNLGLIIVDEEHDSSFKQHDPAPRYNARDSAIYLATLHKAKVLLGTATPAIDTYYQTQQGKFGLVELNERFAEAKLPEMVLSDVREENKRKKTDSIFSQILLDEIEVKLKNKEQVILFQNRRGFAPMTECKSCGWVPQCVQCDVSMIYHKHSTQLHCHYCGYTTQPPAKCVPCGGNDLRYRSFGTEKIEEELELLFPEAKIARMDLDSTRSKNAYANLIEEFETGAVDILVGTQMVTKGLDFDRVSLVGVLNADQVLNYPDFRSHERGFQLLEQVSGRAGRKEIEGKVIIQTSQLNHKVLQYVLNHDYKNFYNQQILERKDFAYPPFFRLIEFVFLDKNISAVNEAAQYFTDLLKGVFDSRVLGPEFPLISRIRGQYHKRTLLKVDKNFSVQKVRHEINRLLDDFRSHKKYKQVRLNVNVDPL